MHVRYVLQGRADVYVLCVAVCVDLYPELQNEMTI